jgi:hypothetical protein
VRWKFDGRRYEGGGRSSGKDTPVMGGRGEKSEGGVWGGEDGGGGGGEGW